MLATLMSSGWSVSLMMMFIPESRITSCNWLRRSLMSPNLGMKVRVSYPFDWNNSGNCLLSKRMGVSSAK